MRSLCSNRPLVFFLVIVGSVGFMECQTQRSQKSQTELSRKMPAKLGVVSKIAVNSEAAPEFGPSMRCDRDGNLYLSGEVFGVPGIRKISPEGNQVTSFDAKPDSHLKVDLLPYFVLGRSDLYVLVYAHEITRYVFVYDSDGKYKSTIKLDPGFPWMPSALAVFQTGEMLLTGSRYIKKGGQYQTAPFTGLFKADGTLIRQITLTDDGSLEDLAESGDVRITSPKAPGVNRAVDFSQAEPGDDGNIYLMRWTNPAIFYVISPAGEVVRRFTIASEDRGMNVLSMHVAGNRIAILFAHPSRDERLLRVTDLEGNEIASYGNSTQTPDGIPGMAFACFSADPEKFMFLGVTENNRLQLVVAEAR